MSSSTLVHKCSTTHLCSCGYGIKPSPAPSGDGTRRRKRRRRTNPTIPDDVLFEILVRLPAKTLFQFNLVSKSCYNLISSPNFISTHYAFHKSDKLSLCCHSYDRCIGASTITFLFSDIALALTTPIWFDRPRIVGCSFGLVCLALFDLDTRYLLWNPATGQFRGFSATGGCCRASTASVYSGFYFDSLANTHKLKRIAIRPPCYGEEKIRVYLDVFTVSNNSWESNKEITLPYEIPNSDQKFTQNTCIARFMYWVMDFPDGKCLLCFDMVDESFRRIELPCLDRRPRISLAERTESLAVFVWDATPFASSGQSFDMWVLNDGFCWSKKLTLRPSLPYVQYPLGFYVKGDVELVVLDTASGYFLWNADSGEATKVLLEGVCVCWFFLYRQSLASVG